MTWVWLSESVVDFGTRAPNGDRETRVVWLHADPSRVFGVPPGSGADEVKRAYRRLVRRHHPDRNPGDTDAPRRFQQIQSALEAMVDEPEVIAHPRWGEWWTITGFAEPDATAREAFAVTGVRIEADPSFDLPPGRVEEELRITYAGQTLPLIVAQNVPSSLWRRLLEELGLYPQRRDGSPNRLARVGALLEPAVLVMLSLVAAPLLAVLLGVLTYLLTDENVPATWAVTLLALCLGWGSLAGVALRREGHAPEWLCRQRRRVS